MDKLNFVRSGFLQILPLNSDASEVEGYISVLTAEFYVHLKVIEGGPVKKVHFQGSWELQQLLQPCILPLQKHLTTCDTIIDMLQEIKNAAEQQLQVSRSKTTSTPCIVQYYELLLKQLQLVGWDRVHYISPSLDSVQFKTIDIFHREHILRVDLPEKFPDDAPTFSYDLPEELIFKWSLNKTLLDVYNYFESCLEKYCSFWNTMEDIDETTWVLEPEHPTRSSCKRRIALGMNSSLLIIVDPSSPSDVPICHFLGPEKIIGPLRENFNKNIDKWDESMPLLSNLKYVLDVEFPSPLTSAKEEFCTECGICYAYRLNDAIPDVICNDSDCNQPFHVICLYEWLRSLPATRHSFNTIFGDCPYCSKPIWCTMPGT